MKHEIHLPTKETATLPPQVTKTWTGIFGVLGILGLAGAAAGFMSAREQFFHSYLAAYVLALSLTLGAMFFTVLQHLAGAHWSVVVRRISETLMANMPLMAILLLPLLAGVFGTPHLYHWADHDLVKGDAVLTAKSGYLNSNFFMIRMVIYFGLWIAIARFFYGNSVATDESGDVSLIQRMRSLSAPAMLAYGLSQSFASFDLLMSLDAHWFSTIFGVYFFAGSIVATFSLITMIALLFRRAGLLTDVITPEHYHDLGKLMFGFTVFWTYIAFSQYFLIWYANLPEETSWFLDRWTEGWKPTSMLILFGRFIIPFAVLMSRHVKRTLPVMLLMTLWVVGMQFVDMYWIVMPDLHKDGLNIHWLDISCLVGVVGIYGAMTVRRFGSHALVPVQDPLLEKSVGFENV